MSERPEPGEVPPPGTDRPPPRRMLDRPPGERYTSDIDTAGADGEAAGSDSSVLAGPLMAGVGAVVGAAAMVALGGPASVTAGLVVVALVVGVVVGRGLRGRAGIAVLVAIAAVAVGYVGVWLFARSEGGVLGLFDYLFEVDGFLPLVAVVVAAISASVAAR
jgi:hypothetical protein